MKVVLKRVGEGPQVIEIEHTLEKMQELVGGLIDFINIEKGISVVFDDEGKLKGKEPNVLISRGTWSDVIVGDVFFCGGNEEFISLTDEQIEYILRF